MGIRKEDGTAGRSYFILGCAAEGSLFLLGAGLCGFFGRGFLADLRWDGEEALVGLIGVVPPLVLFYWSLHSRWEALREIRRFLDQLVLPIIQDWHVGQLLLLSVLAGLGEEFLFRGAIQGGLAELVGEIPGLVLASLIFGCCHPMSWSYLILTSLIGLYLGAVWLWTGNLLVPVLIHAVYDFAALLYFRSARLRPDAGPTDRE